MERYRETARRVGTDRTSPFVASINFSTPKCNSCFMWNLFNGFFIPGPYMWGVTPPPFVLPALYVFSDSALIGVRDPNFFSNAGLIYGSVRRANGLFDMPIVGSLWKYDVKEGDTLWIRLGRSDTTVSRTVSSLCYSVAYTGDYSRIVPFVPVTSCHVALDPTSLQRGDSGSPVYALKPGPIGYAVWAYGVLSGREAVCIPGTDYCIILRTIVAPIDWINVKLSG